MFGGSLQQLIIQVVSSWQVWAVTIALVIYISIVRAAGKETVRRPPPPPKGKAKKDKADAKAKPAASSKEDELGLEEEVPIEEE